MCRTVRDREAGEGENGKSSFCLMPDAYSTPLMFRRIFLRLKTPKHFPRAHRSLPDLLSTDEKYSGAGVLLVAPGPERRQGLPRKAGACQHGAVPVAPGEKS